ncbi:hypothetical protein [Sphingomonas oryzagri]
MTTSRHPDDIVIWPDGTTATLGAVHSGGFNHMSDDFEIVPADHVGRLEALGLLSEHRSDHEGTALRKALEFVVLFLAFDGRDRGTDRMDRSLASLCTIARETEAMIRAAMGPAFAAPAGQTGARHGHASAPAGIARPGPGVAAPRSAHVAAIQHGSGYDVFAAFGRERLDHMVASFCRDRWEEVRDERDPALLDDATVTRLWFDGDQRELRTMEIVDDGCERDDGFPVEVH